MTEKKRGRPAQFDEPTVPFAVRVPQSVYDALMRQSLQRDRPASDIARGVLSNYVSRNSRGTESPS